MLRRYFVSEDLTELKTVEHELEQQGINTEQIHVLSEQDANIELHQLPEVSPVLKSDVVHATERGAIIGVIGALLVLLIAYALGWTGTAAGWIPFIFLAIVVLGFCTWEGGFIGIQEPNTHFKQFKDILKQGKHVLFVDVDLQDEAILNRTIRRHPQLQLAGSGAGTPGWLIKARVQFRRFIKVMP
mgnify:CR=1 FL=1